jgi:predicted HD superfamily hydrolase involved in NAD metabolism
LKAKNDWLISDADYQALYLKVIAAVEERLPKPRLAHVQATAACAKRLAELYDIDLRLAEIAALLHDWDKDQPLDELLKAAEHYAIEIGISPEKLLHAQTGAQAVAEVFSELPPAIIQAIDRHTLAAPAMSDLDMIIYIADIIEPNRDFAGIEELRNQVGRLPLALLFRNSLQRTIDYLQSKNRTIHPLSIEALNDINNRIQDSELEDK